MPSHRALVFVGFHAGGSGRDPESQSERLARSFAHTGVEVRTTSAARPPARRLAEQLSSLLRWHRGTAAVIVDAFSHRSFATSYMVTRLGRALGLPVIVVLHGGGLPEFAASRPRVVDSTLRSASRVVAPSPYLARAFTTRGHSVQVIPNLVEFDLLPDPDRTRWKPNVLWMRTFEATYQPRLAVEAFARFHARHPEATMTMAGADHGELGSTQALAEELGIADAVTFPGYLGWDAKADALSSNDLFLNTTRVDNTPVSLLEAAAAGMVIVATDVGGIGDVFTDGTDALLAPDGDAAALSHLLDRAVTDQTMAARLAGSARTVAAGYSWDAVQAGWGDVLAGVGAIEPGLADREGIGALTLDDLVDVSAIHLRSFPQAGLSLLGPEAIRRYYRWQLIGPHDAIALGYWRAGQLVGFVFAGHFRGAMRGFVRSNLPFLARSVITQPSVLGEARVRHRAKLAFTALRPAPPAPEPPAQIPDQVVADTGPHFGVLAIAVDPAAQGGGAASALMDASTEEARQRGCRRMGLTVAADNPRAIGFYEKIGWSRVLEPSGSWSGRMERVLDVDANYSEAG